MLAITWLGHATVAIELDGVRVVTDPVLRSRAGPLTRIPPAVDPGAIGPVDCVLLSHLHADHTDLSTLRRLDRRGPLIAGNGAGAWLRAKRLVDVLELRVGETAEVNGLQVRATPAVHGRRRRPLGPAGDPVGYLVSGTRSVYFAGDTDLFPDMAALRGQVDVALLPVWGWGRRVGPGHLDPQRAARAAALIAPAVVIPIHWGTLRLGRRPVPDAERRRPASQFRALVSGHAPSVEPRVLAVGERVELLSGPHGEDR